MTEPNTILPEFSPTCGYIRIGRFAGRMFTILNPSFLVRDLDDRVIGAIQVPPHDAQECVYQFGIDRPQAGLSRAVDMLTNFGKGYDENTPSYLWPELAGYLSFSEGPFSPLVHAAKTRQLTIRKVEEMS